MNLFLALPKASTILPTPQLALTRHAVAVCSKQLARTSAPSPASLHDQIVKHRLRLTEFGLTAPPILLDVLTGLGFIYSIGVIQEELLLRLCIVFEGRCG